MSWQWHWEKVSPTKGTVQRWLVATLPLTPTPQGKQARLCIHLKQWDDNAAHPRSWCIEILKFGLHKAGDWAPWRPAIPTQISQQDWAAFFSAWDPSLCVVERLEIISRMPSEFPVGTRWAHGAPYRLGPGKGWEALRQHIPRSGGGRCRATD